ncbi:MAG: ATP-binding cassette domain-containing protein [Acidobacteria bacterium]|nr:ATP-binding cassette domain-containing protein [Acidobacteriota bacterium]
MIDIRRLSVGFGQQPVLNDIDLHIGAGERVLLAGASGSGKSTLLRCIAGIVPHAVAADITGRITVAGRDTASTPLGELAQTVGLVFQNPAVQLFNLTVGEEVAFGPLNLGLTSREVRARSEWALSVSGLTGREAADVRTLSGGEQQRLAIAAVLAMRPAVLALDEPLASLDVESSRRLIGALDDLSRSTGTTVVVAEHRLREGAELASRTVLLDDGRAVADGRTATLMDQRALLRDLGLRRPTSASQSSWEQLIGPMATPGGVPIVELRGVEAWHGRQCVLGGLDLVIHEGEFVALVGDNGSGKSTVAKVLAGILRPKTGVVRWTHGKPVPGRDVGILLQDSRWQLFCDTVASEVALGPSNFGLDSSPLVSRLLNAADLEQAADRPLHTLSAGQQQRAALCAVLALEPMLLILDEPTIGQDWRHLERLMTVVSDMNRRGCAVLLISHDFKLIHRHASRIVMLRDGRIAADGVPATGQADEAQDIHAI